jgi:uncharacterized protein YgiM (DUF1202 family)
MDDCRDELEIFMKMNEKKIPLEIRLRARKKSVLNKMDLARNLYAEYIYPEEPSHKIIDSIIHLIDALNDLQRIEIQSSQGRNILTNRLSLQDALLKITTDPNYGFDILDDRLKCRGLLHDYTGDECVEEIKTLNIILEKNIHKTILNTWLYIDVSDKPELLHRIYVDYCHEIKKENEIVKSIELLFDLFKNLNVATIETIMAEKFAAEKAKAKRLAEKQAEEARIVAEKAEARRLTEKLVEEARIATEREKARHLAEKRAEEARFAAERADKKRFAKKRVEKKVRPFIIAASILTLTILSALYFSNKVIGPGSVPKYKILPENETMPSSQVIYAYVNSFGLNFRSTPISETDENIIAEILQNEQVQVLEKRDDGWTRIKYKNKEGYVGGSYLSTKPVIIIPETNSLPVPPSDMPPKLDLEKPGVKR